MAKYKVVHYINQFYAGIGGEEMAHVEPSKQDGVVGPGQAIASALGDDIEIVGTVICGDGYFNENLEKARADVLEMIKSYNPDLVIAGPAFNAGRYGVASGNVGEMVTNELNIPSVCGMFEENPGVDMFKKDTYILKVGSSAASMRKAVPMIANLVTKLLKGEETDPDVDNYHVRNRKNFFMADRGSKRAVDMLISKMKDEAFKTEFPMPEFDNVDPSPAIKDIKNARIALVTSGGVVPKGNPDRIESSNAQKYGKYNIDDVQDFTSEGYETAHGGYDPTYCNQDADRVLPIDVIRELISEGEIGSLHPYFYTTVGNGTAVASSKKFAADIAQDLVADNVDGVILTST